MDNLTRLAAQLLGQARRLAGTQARIDSVAYVYIDMAAKSESFEGRFVDAAHRDEAVALAFTINSAMAS